MNATHSTPEARRLFAEGWVQTDAALAASQPPDGRAAPPAGCRWLLAPEFYTGPEAAWREVLQRARALRGFQGEYRRAATELEVWSDHTDGRSLDWSCPLAEWPVRARELQASPLTRGYVGLRTAAAGDAGSPAITVVMESPGGGALAGLWLSATLEKHGVNCGFGTVEGRGRWGLYKQFWTPHWYARSSPFLFGLDWDRWLRADRDVNDNKRFWIEHMTCAVLRAIKELPPLCCDSVLFDEYIGCDRLGLLPAGEIRRLCQTPVERLAPELQRLNATPVCLPERDEEKLAAHRLYQCLAPLWNDDWDPANLDPTEKRGSRTPRRARGRGNGPRRGRH